MNLYALTRYNFVRSSYAFIRGLMSSDPLYDKTYDIAKFDSDELKDFSIKKAASNLNEFSWTPIPSLSSDTINQIYAHSLKAKGRRPSYDKNEEIYFDQVTGGKLPSSEPIIMLRIDPSDCPAIEHLNKDPLLLDLAESYLGYKPKHVEAQLLWSFHDVEMSLEKRHKLAQAVYYHWDSMAVNGFRVNYYLTDVTKTSGAHMLIPRSHRRKPLKYLFARSTTIDEKPLIDFYEDEETIVGKAGTGFAQDVNGFHKALAPQTSDRLHLHIRYT